jgi:hypothetical protein
LEQHSRLVGGGAGGDVLDRRAVTLDGRLEHDRGQRPLRRLWQPFELERRQCLSVGQLPGRRGRGGWERTLAEAVEQPVDARCDRAVAGQRAPVRAGGLAQRQEPPEHPVGVGQASRQHRLGSRDHRHRVDDAVQGHGPNPPWEQVGVGLADQGPVGLAEVAELPVADHLAKMIQVAGGVGGGDVGQYTVPRSTALRQLDRLGQVAALLRPGGGHWQAVPEVGPLAGVGEAAHRGAGAGAAADVPADDVEAAAGHRVQGLAALGDHGHAGVAGPARVDEQ